MRSSHNFYFKKNKRKNDQMELEKNDVTAPDETTTSATQLNNLPIKQSKTQLTSSVSSCSSSAFLMRGLSEQLFPEDALFSLNELDTALPDLFAQHASNILVFNQAVDLILQPENDDEEVENFKKHVQELVQENRLHMTNARFSLGQYSNTYRYGINRHFNLLQLAAFFGKTHFMDILVQQGMKFAEIDSPLFWAVEGGCIAAMQWCLARGIDINIAEPSRFNHNALYYARNVETIKFLLSHGAVFDDELNNTYCKFNTPEEIAVFFARLQTVRKYVASGNLDAIKTLQLNYVELQYLVKIGEKNKKLNLDLIAWLNFQSTLSEEIKQTILDYFYQIIVQHVAQQIKNYSLPYSFADWLDETSGRHLIYFAAQCNQPAAILDLYQQGENIQAVTKNAAAALEVAIRDMRVQAFDQLIALDANVCAIIQQEKNKLLLFEFALSFHHKTDIVERLIKLYQFPVTELSLFLFKIISARCPVNMYDLLKQYGANPHICGNYTGNSLLHAVVATSDIDLAYQLLIARVNINNKNIHEITPLDEAVRQKKHNMINFLIGQGANVINQEVADCAFEEAVSEGNIDFAELLLEYYSVLGRSFTQPNIILKNKNTQANVFSPLALATFKNDVAMTSLLLKFGAQVEGNRHVTETNAMEITATQNDTSICSPLRIALQNNCFDVAKVLFAANADPNNFFEEKDYRPASLLFYAIFFNHPDFALALLKKGSDPTWGRPDSLPFEVAYKMNYIDVVIAIIKYNNQHHQNAFTEERMKLLPKDVRVIEIEYVHEQKNKITNEIINEIIKGKVYISRFFLQNQFTLMRPPIGLRLKSIAIIDGRPVSSEVTSALSMFSSSPLNKPRLYNFEGTSDVSESRISETRKFHFL